MRMRVRPTARGTRRNGAAWCLALAAAATCAAPARPAERALPIDCLPDRILRWDAAAPSPEARFGATSLPGIVLGPPGDSAATTGSTSVASLGHGGVVEIGFGDAIVEDRPGPDFIVFENAFFVGAAPTAPSDDFQIFVEPGIVEVSADGQTWLAFPYDAQALADATGTNADRALYERLVGLAGITPTFAGNWTVPDDPLVWDPSGVGGVSGAGGDAFDLAAVGLSEARFVRITDGDSRNGPPGAAEGFDLDAIVVLHGRPAAPPPGADGDGDGLSDLAEQVVYGTNPLDADSEGDGTDDGRELAGCRDPNTVASDPWWVAEPRLWLRDDGTGCTELRWTFLGSTRLYDVVRGELDELALGVPGVDLGPTACLSDDAPGVRWTCDADPVPAGGFFYVVRDSAAAHYGRSSDLEPRATATGCP